MKMQLKLDLLSDATFGNGSGVAGLIDAEVEHDEYGCPLVRGRTLKGLLVEECSNVLYAVGLLYDVSIVEQLETCAQFLFGRPGSASNDGARMDVGPGRLPLGLRKVIKGEVKGVTAHLTSNDVLDSLTTIRRQTAVDAATGAPERNGLRSRRAVVRGITMMADLQFFERPCKNSLALLAASCLALKRGGLNRNRGAGRVIVSLLDESGADVTNVHFENFKSLCSKTRDIHDIEGMVA